MSSPFEADEHADLREEIAARIHAEAVQQELLHDLQVHQIELQTQNEDLRIAQEQLAAARDRYRDLYDFAPVGYLTIDEHGCLLQVNFTFSGLLGGIEREHLLHKPLAHSIARESQDDFHFFWQRLKQCETMETVELRVHREDGMILWARFDAIVGPQTFDVEAREYRLTVSDITERKQAEESLRASEERFRVIAENTPDILVRFNRAHQYIYVNPAITPVTGVLPADFRGKTNQELGMPA